MRLTKIDEEMQANASRTLGAEDCAQGLACKNLMPEAYYLGYSEQYAQEQQQSQGAYN